jgi:hypothetical protein
VRKMFEDLWEMYREIENEKKNAGKEDATGSSSYIL